MGQSLMSDSEVNILVIDDDPGAFALVNQMLLTVDRPRIMLDWVDSYEKGLTALQENKHDVYLIDYRLGDKDGTNLLRTAAETGVDAPILLLTAYGTYDTDVEAMHLGAVDYLDKRHLSPELLERSIRYAVERKRNERELRRLNEQVAALEQLKTDMIRVAAHDIRNPITCILMNVQILRRFADQLDSNTQGRYNEAVEGVYHSTRTIQNITASILSLERIEEMFRSQVVDTEVNPVVTSVYRDYERNAKDRSQIFTLQMPDESIHVLSDAVLLSQVIGNLVENAIKYTPEGGRIDVRLKRAEGDMVFEVEDNGDCIPSQFTEKVFQPFFRLPGQQETSGTGLGLYLVKSIVLRHKGRLIVHSVPGKGSTFGFSLPVHRQATTPDSDQERK